MMSTSKLDSAESVYELRMLYAKGWRVDQLRDRYEVGWYALRDALTGKSFPNAGGPLVKDRRVKKKQRRTWRLRKCDIADIYKLYEEGEHPGNIAKKLDTTTAYIHKIMKTKVRGEE